MKTCVAIPEWRSDTSKKGFTENESNPDENSSRKKMLKVHQETATMNLSALPNLNAFPNMEFQQIERKPDNASTRTEVARLKKEHATINTLSVPDCKLNPSNGIEDPNPAINAENEIEQFGENKITSSRLPHTTLSKRIENSANNW